MKLQEGQFVFLRNGVNLEVVTFVRFSEPPNETCVIATDELNANRLYRKPGATAVIHRRSCRLDELAMLADISPIPTAACNGTT
jgi:hypothetical protein